jgi:hypothetical protein
MDKQKIPSKRRTITLTEAREARVEAYRQEHGIRSVNEALDRLIAAGLTVKVAVVGKNAKRSAL